MRATRDVGGSMLFFASASKAWPSDKNLLMRVLLPILTSELLDKFIVVPEHHLLFCYIDKNACTAFNELFMRVRGQTVHGGDVWYKNTLDKHGLTAHLPELLRNTTWHKAVFYREPLERFVSAYISKCVPHHDKDPESHCKQAFGRATVSFQDAVATIARKDKEEGVRHATNRHFMHQHRFCGGLLDTLQYYDTVEQLDAATSHHKVAKMLRAVGIGDVPALDTLFPPSNRSVKKSFARRSAHITNAAHTTYVQDDPRAAGVLTRHYAADYFLFGMPTPTWAIKAYEDQKTC